MREKTILQSNKSERILSLNALFVKIRMSVSISGRICTQVYNILAILTM